MDEMRDLFNDINRHLLEDGKPSAYFESLLKNEIFKNAHPFTMISGLTRVEQSPEHHPEGNVWNHTMLVIDNAAQIKGQTGSIEAFMWAALLHDIGKAPATKLRKGRITSYDHDKEGERMAVEFLSCFNCREDFIIHVSRLVRWHMQILFVVKGLPFAEIEKMKSQVSVREIALLGLCDRLGRKGDVDVEKEKKNILKFIEKCEIEI